MSDKKIERQRYDAVARNLLLDSSKAENFIFGSSALPRYLASPYIDFEEKIDLFINKNSFVLEIGSGTGLHTGKLLETGAIVVGTDISNISLEVLRKRYKKYKKLRAVVSDMETLAFEDASFDAVVSAGSISYGDPKLVMKEIHRILKHDGVFICIDSLSHNPIYRFNRWIHYIKGNRSQSTLSRMPTLALIGNYVGLFQNVNVKFFGSITWLAPFLIRVIGDLPTKKLSDNIDRLFSIQKSAFKFVMVARK